MTASEKNSYLHPIVLENILPYLNFHDVINMSAVFKKHSVLCEVALYKGAKKIVEELSLKLYKLEDCIKQLSLSPDKFVRFNSIYTMIEIVCISVYSLYVISRWKINNDRVKIGIILDEVKDQASYLNVEDCNEWFQYLVTLQNSLSIYILPTIEQQSKYQLGIYVMDLLDTLIGVNYTITTTFYLKRHTCSINAYYYTDNMKFLSFIPDIWMLKDCEGKELTADECSGILKSLAMLVNLHNGLYCNSQEYGREKKMSKISEFSKNTANIFSRKPQLRRVLEAGRVVVDEYSRYFGKYRGYEKRDVLNCHVHLDCDLDNCPFRVLKSYESILNEIDESMDVSEEENTYNFEINLQLTVSNNESDIFEISLTDS